MCFIEEDKKILKEKGFNFITVYGDGVIKLFKIGLNAGLDKKSRDLSIKFKIQI